MHAILSNSRSFKNNQYFEKSVTIKLPEKEYEIFVRIHDFDCLEKNLSLEWAVLLALFPIMQHVNECHIHGNVSKEFISNICEFNSIWNSWMPKRYKIVKFSFDTPILSNLQNNSIDNGYVFAFSGGVDASATLLRHARLGIGERKKSPERPV